MPGLPASAIPLGPFSLLAPVGEGGAGHVWRAVHRGDDTPVAVKLLKAPFARDARALNLFRAEAQRWARLDHPAIITLLEQARVPHDHHTATGWHLQADTPYLVLEYASGGSLAGYLDGPMPWAFTQDVLATVLEALAYVHARGIAHRDLKPANLLLCTSEDLRPGLKLTDFGTAHLWREGAAFAHGRTGTPAYMAPEQWRGGLASQGPWTDLYAVGCIAYELATGSPPFGRVTSDPASLATIERAHREARPLPVDDPRLPPGFAAWVDQLLAKRPADRYPDAAAAGRALGALRHGVSVPTAPAPAVPAPDGATQESLLLPPPPAPAVAVPRDWRAPGPPARPVRLLNAGLGLFGLRSPRFGGREDERDRLWARLRETVDGARPLGVAIRGRTGVGKTRLAGWMAERAAELGLAEALTRPPGLGIRAADGVEGLLAGLFRLTGLTAEQAREQLAGLYAERDLGTPEDARALADAVLPPAARGAATPAPDRVGSLLGALVRLGRRRPLVLVFDDLDQSPSTIAFVRRLLDEPGPLAILVVVTVNDDALGAVPEGLRGEIEALCVHPRMSALALAPLPAEVQRDLVASLLPIEPGALARLTERCGGNPLLALEVVGDCVSQGLLQPGPHGFVLPRGVGAALPDRLYAVWPDRLARALQGLPPDAGEALVVAAALGVDVAAEDWRQACAEHGVEPRDELVERLVRAGLALRTEPGWAFAHEMVRAAVQRGADEEGTWEAVNDACARALVDATRGPRHAERVGSHLAAAGRLREAVGPLLEGVDEAIAGSRIWEARALLDLRGDAVAALKGAAAERAGLEGDLRRARLLVLQGDYPSADALARKVAEGARAHRLGAVRAFALYLRAQSAEKRRDPDTAEAFYDAAQAAAEEDEQLRASCLEHRGTLARFRGEYATALDLLEAARAAFAALGSLRGVAQCLTEKAGTHIESGALDAAAVDLDASLAVWAGLGDRGGEADALNNRGDLHRARGELHEARRCFAGAVERLRGIGGGRADIPVTNLALVSLELGEGDEAYVQFQESLALAARPGRGWLVPYAHLGLLVCEARRGDWAAVARRRDVLLQRGDLALDSPDLVRLATEVWELGCAAGQSPLLAALRAALDRAARRAR